MPRLAVAATKTRVGLVGAQVGFLHAVFRILVIAQEPAGEIISGIDMGHEDLLEPRLCRSLPERFVKAVHHT